MPVAEVGGRTDSDNVITILIPDMNFTHHATITGFTVTGIVPINSKIQIWRQNTSQFDVYDRVADITVDINVCVSSGPVANDVFFCILHDEFQVSIQPGDFIGLELPKTTDNSGIYFTTSGGPKNYVFERAHELTSPIKLDDSDNTTDQQPQIAFSLTIGIIIHCYN